MSRLDYKESWAQKNWCFWTVGLEKTLESPLDCKEIKPVHPKGNQSWIFIGRTDMKLKLQYFGHLMQRTDSLEKTLMLGKTEGRRRRGRQRMRWLDASLTRWTWVWANSRCWWWTGKAGMLQSMGLQRVRHDWVTELNWTETLVIPSPVKVIDLCNTSQCFLVSVFWMLYFCKRLTFRKVHLLSQYDDFLPSFFFTISERVA